MAARRGRGRPRNNRSNTTAEFFKIFLPHLHSHQLLIPPEYMNDFSRTIQERVVLRDIGGKLWHVDVEKTRDETFLKNGWQKFVSYHGLKPGELLVFKYDGSYSFVVRVFGTNGCKKAIPAALKNVKLEENSEEEIETKPAYCKRARVYKDDVSVRSNQRTGVSRDVEDVELQNVASEEPENSTSLENADPESPCFVASPILARQYKLRIPSTVTSRRDIHIESDMVLRSDDGKEWPVRVYSQKDGRTYIGKGLSAFHKENNLGDVNSCVFTFPTTGLSNTIDVQISLG